MDPELIKKVLRQMALGAWQAPQTAIGIGSALAEGAGRPGVNLDDGRLSLRFRGKPGTTPRALGQVRISPPDIDDVSEAHETVHQRQSEQYGPAYIPASMIGTLMSMFETGDPELAHPFEDEAYLETEPHGGLSNRLAFKAAARRLRGR